jgi:hypothetical protein
MGLSDFFLLPFRILLPSILETPMSTIRLPSTLLTMLLVIVSFSAIVGGAVYCYVRHPPWTESVVDRTGAKQNVWICQNRLGELVQIEAVIVGIVFGLAGLSLIAAFSALTARNRTGFIYAYVYRFGFTFPVWAIITFIIFKMKLRSWDLYFMPDPILR